MKKGLLICDGKTIVAACGLESQCHERCRAPYLAGEKIAATSICQCPTKKTASIDATLLGYARAFLDIVEGVGADGPF
jgi:hypothetical protein